MSIFNYKISKKCILLQKLCHLLHILTFFSKKIVECERHEKGDNVKGLHIFIFSCLLLKKGGMKMNNITLKNLIERFQKQDMSVFNSIYGAFKGLILLYANRIDEDDTVQELTMFLIELLYTVDLDVFNSDDSDGLKRYIAVALRNKYINLYKLNKKYRNVYDVLYGKEMSVFDDVESKLYIDEAMQYLSEKQRLIILYKYIYNYSDIEIALMLDISRQAVNRLKNRALKALRKAYVSEKDFL